MKKGISLAAVIATITIMLILITTVTISGSKMVNNTKKTSFATEISTIQKAVDSYLQKNENEYPILNNIVVNLSNVSDENQTQFTNNGDTITNDTISLFEIDYEKIGYTDLKYGNKKDGENDVYLLSAISGKVYYAKGFTVGENVYYTLTLDLEKVLEYKTTDTIITSDNNIISYSQENLENSQKKVTVKIPVSYTVTSVKVGDTIYSSTTQNGYNIYEIIEIPGTVIDVIYTYNGETISTSYTIKASNEKTDEGYIKDGLLLYLDGINNTGNGHSSTTTVWKDLSGNENNGTLYNIGSEQNSGWNGNYLTLDGINDFVDLGLENYDFNNGITMAIIVRFNEYLYEEFFGNWESAGGGLGAYSAKKITCNFNIDTSSAGVQDFEVLELNRDYYIYITYDGNYLKMYIDGILKSQKLCSGTIKTSKAPFFIGANPTANGNPSGNYSNVSIKKAMIYNRGLTENEIKENYKIDRERFGI